MTDTFMIGLMGAAGAGKDTVGQMLVEDHGFTRVSFAEPLYRALEVLNPYVGIRSDGKIIRLDEALQISGSWDVAKRQTTELRRLLQVMGTEVGRDIIGKDVWVDIAMREAQKYPRVVFTDLRFANEHWAVSNHGEIWLVCRISAENKSDEGQTHASTLGWRTLPSHRVLYNDFSLDDLRILVNQRAQLALDWAEQKSGK